MSTIKNLEKTFEQSEEKNKVVGGTLYLVATPIGNLSDLSQRALKVLSEVDFIAAEDTRNGGKLLAISGLDKKNMISYYEHNKRERGEEIAKRLLSGLSCALITDAGTPAISDPGEDIVKLCIEKGIPVTAIPGPCAAITGLVLSGLFCGRFCFEGFLSGSKSERRERLDQIKDDPRTIIFYEAPHKLVATLQDLYETFGNRQISLARELTKRNEEIMRTNLLAALEYYKEHSPKGEYVLVISGASREELNDRAFWSNMNLGEHVAHYKKEGLSEMDAMKAVAKDRKISKSEVYKYIQKSKQGEAI